MWVAPHHHPEVHIPAGGVPAGAAPGLCGQVGNHPQLLHEHRGPSPPCPLCMHVHVAGWVWQSHGLGPGVGAQATRGKVQWKVCHALCCARCVPELLSVCVCLLLLTLAEGTSDCAQSAGVRGKCVKPPQALGSGSRELGCLELRGQATGPQEPTDTGTEVLVLQGQFRMVAC